MQCINRAIQFSCNADGTGLDFIAVRDLCSLFGNIIDNAIEAVCSLEEEKRVIRGSVGCRQNMLVIKFENYYEGSPVDGSKLLETTKKDKWLHGYGLKSINYVAEKYNGFMSMTSEDNWMVVQVVIPCKGKKV